MRALLLAALPLVPPAAAQDWRDLREGTVLLDSGYCDQPLAVTLQDGSWLVVVTTGKGHEGSQGQHVVALRSEDQGQTWSAPIPIEPADGPEASWAQPLLAPSGRVYAFYVFNDSGVTDRRADLLGQMVMRWSDDGGRTWSERLPIPIRETAIDRGNDFGGQVRMQWGVSRVQVHEGEVLLPFTKIGKYLVDDTEAWYLHSADLLSASDPATATWSLRPDGERGVRGTGPINSEPDLVTLPDGSLATVIRTVHGTILFATSDDAGRSWSEPRALTDADGVPIRHPRACVRLWPLGDDRFLLWCHENGATGWAPGTRNPAWVRGGVWTDGALAFGPAEVLLYDRNPEVRISYPDLVLQGERAFVLATEKAVTRCHEIEPGFLQALFDGLPARLEGAQGWISSGQAGRRLMPPKQAPASWTFLGVVEPPVDGKLPMTIAQAMGPEAGLALRLNDELGLELELKGAGGRHVVSSQPGALTPGAPNEVAVIFDAEPGIVRWIVNGRVLDGGSHRDRGWSWIDAAARAGRDEKFWYDDRPRELLFDDGGRFQLAAPDESNARIVRLGQRETITHPFGDVRKVGIVFTGVGFQPHQDKAFPADGILRFSFADGFEQEVVWDLRDSNGQGRGDRAQPIGQDWDLVDTRTGQRWAGRRLWWQTIEIDGGRQLESITLDLRTTVDQEGADAEFALLAISTTGSGGVSGTPLAPVELPAEAWNADVFAERERDDAGRGFRDAQGAGKAVVDAALAALTRQPLELGSGAAQGAHFARALLAREVIALTGK